MENEKNASNNQMHQEAPSAQSAMQKDQSEKQESAQIKYAGFWIRWAALFIDNLLLSVSCSILGGMAGFIIGIIGYGAGINEKGLTIALAVIGYALGFIITWLYFIIMTYKYGATLGKMAVGVRVVSDKENNLTLGQIILRETVGKIVSTIIFSIGYIMAGFTRRKQALHDKMASTVVIYKDPNKKSGVWVIVVVLILTVLILIATIGILASIVLVSLSSARDKASDAAIKASLSAVIPDAIIYQDSKGTLNGFSPRLGIKVPDCSEEPIFNISKDGKEMAIFEKLCADEEKYFCVDLSGESSEVDRNYAKSGAVTCDFSVSSENSLSNGNTSAVNNLTNIFKDDSLGYEIEYPGNWIQQRQFDSENGITLITLLPNEEDIKATIYVENLSIPQEITPDDLVDFIEILQGELEKENGSVYDEKDFIYAYEDGTKSLGKEFKSEYFDNGNGMKLKQLDIAIPNGNKLYLFTFVSDIGQYDSNYKTAQAMLDSWKIKK